MYVQGNSSTSSMLIQIILFNDEFIQRILIFEVF